jgi:hypothetical protein
MSTLIACAVCSGALDSLQFKGMQMGILALLVFTACMLVFSVSEAADKGV